MLAAQGSCLQTHRPSSPAPARTAQDPRLGVIHSHQTRDNRSEAGIMGSADSHPSGQTKIPRPRDAPEPSLSSLTASPSDASDSSIMHYLNPVICYFQT